MLLVSARRKGRTLTLAIELRKQHYLQACAQLSASSLLGMVLAPVYAQT